MKTSTLTLAVCLMAAVNGVALAQGGGGRGMMRADTNGDGMISKAEALAQADQRFDAMDANKDGVLAADEMTGPGARMMERADKDGDGKITRAQYEASAMKRFARLDTDNDGMISADELRAGMERLRAMRGAGPGGDPANAIGPAPAAPPPPPPPPPGQ